MVEYEIFTRREYSQIYNWTNINLFSLTKNDISVIFTSRNKSKYNNKYDKLSKFKKNMWTEMQKIKGGCFARLFILLLNDFSLKDYGDDWSSCYHKSSWW